MEETTPVATTTEEDGASPRPNLDDALLPLPRDSVTLSVPSSSRKLPRRSKESLAFHSDPFNRPELVHTLRGRELILFVVLYAIGVMAIVLIFETTMPVYWVNDQIRAEQHRRAAIVRSAQKVMRDRQVLSFEGTFGGTN